MDENFRPELEGDTHSFLIALDMNAGDYRVSTLKMEFTQ